MDTSSINNVELAKSTSIWIDQDASYSPRSTRTYQSEQSQEADLQNNFVFTYFQKKKIQELFHFMVQHLIINEPDNPLEYLKDLTDKLLLWRSGTVKKAPHIFEPRHVEAIYRAFDPACEGFISLEQYHQGFKTLMLADYEIFPMLCDDYISVTKEVFIKNMVAALDKNLMSLVLPPYHNLCEFTILPNESYNILFQDLPSKKAKGIASSHGGLRKQTLEEPTDSCESMVSCVQLRPTVREEEEIDSNASDYVHGGSEYEAISEVEVSNVDFLMTRRGTLISKITLVAGKIGIKTKELITKVKSVNDNSSDELAS